MHYLGKSRTFLISIARDAIVLFGSETSERIRQCEGEGSEAALRRLVEGIQAGNPPYEDMSSQLEQLVRLP